MLAIACVITYWVSTHLLTRVSSLNKSDDVLGGMWAVCGTVFVYRGTQADDATAALSRMSATLVSFVVCLAYLLVFPFNAIGLGVLIGLGTVLLTILGRPGDVVTAGITTTVVMVVADLNPDDAWLQPILRLFDTIVGVGVALAAVWVATEVTTRLRTRSEHSRRSASTQA